MFDMFSLIRHEAYLGNVLSAFYCESYGNIMREAEEIIREIDGLSDQKKAQYLKRYKEDYKKTRANFGEWYYGYNMYALSGKEKKSFLTTQDIIAISKKYELRFPEQLPTTKYKDRFLGNMRPLSIENGSLLRGIAILKRSIALLRRTMRSSSQWIPAGGKALLR